MIAKLSNLHAYALLVGGASMYISRGKDLSRHDGPEGYDPRDTDSDDSSSADDDEPTAGW